MNRNTKIIAAVALAIVIVGGGYGIYHLEVKAKGQMITIETGDNLTAPLTRIVSLDPAATATLYALGAYKYLVGGNSYDSYPPNESIPNVTDYPSMDVSQILNLSPQAVISFTNYSSEQINQLLDSGIDYIFISSGSDTGFNTIEKQNTLLGDLTGTEHNASVLNSWINTSISDLRNQAKSFDLQYLNGTPVNGFYYLDSSGGIWTAGNTTFINSYFNLSDVVNIAAPYYNGFYTISSGEIADHAPDVIFLDQYVNASAVTVSPFSSTPAVKDNRVFTVPSDSIFNEPNFRDIFAVQWMIDETYGHEPSIPAFPLNLSYNPNPAQ
jgi:iron complex transport system substrate-binding protein